MKYYAHWKSSVKLKYYSQLSLYMGDHVFLGHTWSFEIRSARHLNYKSYRLSFWHSAKGERLRPHSRKVFNRPTKIKYDDSSGSQTQWTNKRPTFKLYITLFIINLVCVHICDQFQWLCTWYIMQRHTIHPQVNFELSGVVTHFATIRLARYVKKNICKNE